MAKHKAAKYKGVYFNKLWNKWTVMIWKEQSNVYLGSYDTAEEGHKVRVRAEKLLASGTPITGLRAALALSPTSASVTKKAIASGKKKAKTKKKPKATKKAIYRVRRMLRKLADPQYEKRTSKYTGVGRHNRGKKWIARICHNYKQVSLGLYSSEKNARRARLLAEKLLAEGVSLTNLREQVRSELA